MPNREAETGWSSFQWEWPIPRGLVASTSDSCIQEHAQQLRQVSLTTDSAPSAWDTTEACTPCTTRPHFVTVRTRRTETTSIGRDSRHARNRSRSWGSSSLRERENTTQVSAWSTERQRWQPVEYRPLLSATSAPSYTPSSPSNQLPIAVSSVSLPTPSSFYTSPRHTEKQISQEQNGAAEWIHAVVYGIINGTIVLPVLLSFGSIIYRDLAFAPYMPALIKLTLASGIVHQLCFSTYSNLPFAIGQVQDAGLIFLSGMASQIAQYCQQHQYNDEVMLATATVGLSLATALLGVGLVLVGRWRLAQYVQMLPTSVIGGYLAYIGWFCGLAGVGLMAGDSRVTWSLMTREWRLLVPGLLGGAFIYGSARKLKHMAVLPTCIVFLLLAFYACLWWTGTSLQEATDAGWIRQMDPPPPWYHTWSYLKPGSVAWGVLPHLFLTELSMIFVVALSSSLDVAAIELELGEELDYNHELGTVGVSNIISGLTGGYTGSYIFSQSIFSLRAGIRSRLSGYVLAIFQTIVLVLPFPMLSYVPNFFFGSLLSMISIDLIYEWLWDVRRKLVFCEYMVCLGTFVSIMLTNVEYGILIGVASYMGLFRAGFDMGSIRIHTAEDDSVPEDVRPSSSPVNEPGLSLHHPTMVGSTASPSYGTIS